MPTDFTTISVRVTYIHFFSSSHVLSEKKCQSKGFYAKKFETKYSANIQYN